MEISTIVGILTIAGILFSAQWFIFRSIWKIKETLDSSLTKGEATETYLSKTEAKALWHEIASESVELDSKFVTGTECEKYRHCMLQQIDKKTTDSSSLFMKTVNDVLHISNSVMQKIGDMEKAMIQDKERRDSEREHRKLIDNIQAAATERMNDVLEKINSNLDEIKPVVYHLNAEHNRKVG